MNIVVNQQDSFRAAVLNGSKISFAEKTGGALAATEVRVNFKAASLNARDLMILDGQFGPMPSDLIPLSDAAGEVVAVGDDVTRWNVGDRVMPIFYQEWIDGRLKSGDFESALGFAKYNGVLAEFGKFDQNTLVSIPDHLDWVEAATLPCAAVTAWHALFEQHRTFTSNDTVLIQGTGGVALFALQFAKAAGAKVIMLSSSDDKLAIVKEMGADITINYKLHPQWDIEVLRATSNAGVDIILELGGKETLERSIRSLAPHGVIAQVGILTGTDLQPDNLVNLILNNGSVSGVLVGSREHFENMTAFVSKHKIKPVVDSTFAFENVENAVAHLRGAQHMGKIAIKISD